MAIVLFNPTNEEFRTQYVGEDVILVPGAKVRVDDPRGRHVLNVLGPRGLVTLEYGDEGGGEEKKAETGRKRNKDFKYKQVIDFNTLNEQRFQSRLPYINPPAHVKIYANELGIELRQPYAVADAAKKDMSEAMQRNQELEREVKEKDTELSDLRDQMTELTSQVKLLLKSVAGEKTDPAADAKKGALDLIGKWKSMGSNVLVPWIQKNWDQIQLLPEDAFKDLGDRFLKVCEKKMPTKQEEIDQFMPKAA